MFQFSYKNTTKFLCLLFGIFSFQLLAIEQDEDAEQELESSTNSFSIEDIETIQLRLLKDKPVIDGVISEEFWSFATKSKINLEMYPTRFDPALVDTDVLMAMSATHVYLAFKAYDKDMSLLRSAPRDHDGVKEDDYVSLVVDSTGNLRKKYEFRVNPHGSKSDVLQNTVSDRYIYDWDTDWKAAAKINDDHWLVEMEIPIDSLKEPRAEKGERNKWVVILKRSYPRKIDRTFGGIYLVEPSALRNLKKESKDIKEKDELITGEKSFEAYPYAIYHSNEKRNLDTAFEQRAEIEEFDIGGDFSLTIDNATTIAATINPNFTDVEADIARDSINNPFNIFQPEKRRFFQEDMDLYSTLMPIVYTRNIIDPKIGLSLSHQTKGYSTGAFWSDDEETEVIVPDNLGSDTVELSELNSQSMAARFVSAEKGSAWGLIGTHRSAGDYYNSVASLDGLINLGIDDKLRYQVATSKTKYIDEFGEDLCEEDGCLEHDEKDSCELGSCETNSYVQRLQHDGSIEDHAIQIKYKHTGPKSLFWGNYFNVGKDFRSDLGFIKKVDYKLYNLAYGRNWYFETFSGDGGKSRGRVYFVATQVESQKNEKIETGYDVWAEFRGSYQTVLRPGFRIKERAVNRIEQDTLALKGNAPKFDEKYFQWYLETSPYANWTFNLDGRYGEIADSENILLGDMKEFKPRVRYQIGNFKIDLKHTYRKYDYENKKLYQEDFTTFSVNWRPNDQRQVRFLVKFDETSRDISRWRGDELSYEKELEAELTHTRYVTKQLSFISGLKFKREDDNEINNYFTSERQFYFRVNYNFDYKGK